MQYIVVGKHALNEVEDTDDLGNVVKWNPTKTLHETSSKKIAEWVANNAKEAGWFEVEIIHFDELDLNAPNFANTIQI